MKVEMRALESIKPYEKNAKKHDQTQIDNVAESIKQYGFVQPIVVDRDGVIVIGHCRALGAKKLGLKEVPCVCVDDLTQEQVNALRLVDNKSNESDWDFDLLADELPDLDLSAFDFDWCLPEENEHDESVEHYTLKDLFLFPTFSVLDGRAGEWRERKRQWIGLGIQSELGRGDNLTHSPQRTSYIKSGVKNVAPGTSIFDPVLCEVAYKWFLPNAGSTVLDPFAGGSVRGIVAEKLGYRYTGVDIRQEQIAEDIAQANRICQSPPEYLCGDSREIKKIVGNRKFDLVFSCPPYGDLEVYSDNPCDISNMHYDDFVTAYTQIIKNCVDLLAENRFAIFVVGDIRDKRGFYRDFISDTKSAFKNAGAFLYNEFIKIDPNGNAAMKAKRMFATRKAVKIHQNMLVFYKGDPKKIKENYGEIEFPDMSNDDLESENDY